MAHSAPPNTPPAGTAERVAWIDEDVAAAFPAEDTPCGVRSRGPGFCLSVLSRSRDFWDDPPQEVVEATEAAVEAERDEVAAVLTRRWGAPEAVDLFRYQEALMAGAELPDPLGRLCSGADLLVWRVSGTGRWVGLSVTQEDAELPFELSAAVGTESALALPEAPGGRPELRPASWSSLPSAPAPPPH